MAKRKTKSSRSKSKRGKSRSVKIKPANIVRRFSVPAIDVGRLRAISRATKPPAARSPKPPTPPIPSAAKIFTAGIFEGFTLDAYHGDLCDGLSVSASTLITLHRSCPAKAWAQHYGSPDPIDGEDSAAMTFGTAAHVLILEGLEAFRARYAIKPEGMRLNTTAGMAWSRAQKPGLEILTTQAFEAMAGMRDALFAHPKAGWAFSAGRAEVTCAIKDAETGIWLKARPDYLRPTLALNYKTARDASPGKWQRQAWALDYAVAAALTIDVLKALDRPVNYAFVIQESKPPYLPAIRVLSDDFIQGGRMIYRHALRRFAECASAGKWPGFDVIETVQLPIYADRELANMESPL